MERIKQRQEYVQNTLARLSEVLDLPVNKIHRDSALLRFQLCVEAMWKYAQIYLNEKNSIVIMEFKLTKHGNAHSALQQIKE